MTTLTDEQIDFIVSTYSNKSFNNKIYGYGEVKSIYLNNEKVLLEPQELEALEAFQELCSGFNKFGVGLNNDNLKQRCKEYFQPVTEIKKEGFPFIYRVDHLTVIVEDSTNHRKIISKELKKFGARFINSAAPFGYTAYRMTEEEFQVAKDKINCNVNYCKVAMLKK